MATEIPNAEKAKEDAKRKETPRALKKAHRKVAGHVESSKPGPDVEHVEQGPDTAPAK